MPAVTLERVKPIHNCSIYAYLLTDNSDQGSRPRVTLSSFGIRGYGMEFLGQPLRRYWSTKEGLEDDLQVT